jgi:DNA topoisomerase-2
MDKKLISDFYKSDAPTYASADNIRKIGSYIDGLKLSARKLIYTLFEKYPAQQIKTAQFAAFTAAFTNYNQGENNLGGVANTLAQSFMGTNNYPLLEGKGNFGNLFDKECAATRYTYVKASKYLDLFFNKTDRTIVGNQLYEGDKIEPLFYVPIIPVLLLNGSNGLSTGFRQVIHPRDIKEIIKYILSKLEDKTTDKFLLLPKYRGFTGEFKYIIDLETNERSIECYGVIEKQNSTTYLIKELPINTEYTKYIDFLDKLVDNKTIIDYIDKCDPKENKVLFEIKTTRDFTKKNDNNLKLLQIFKLIKPISEIYNCIDQYNRICEFKSIEEILDAFIKIRLHYYDIRKNYLLTELRDKLILLTSKYIFVKNICEDQIIINKKSKADIIKQIEAFPRISKIDDSYEYLLKMQLSSLTKEMMEKLAEEILKYKNEFNNIKSTDIKTMWLNDLTNLSKNLN